MGPKKIDLEVLRHSLGHVLGYVRAASKEVAGQENQAATEALLGFAIERLEKALDQLDFANGDSGEEP
jgi:hypothetical protein